MPSDWQIPQKVVRERADEYAASQRRAFLNGFEAAMSEAETMAELREWLETQRDDAERRYQEQDDDSMFVRMLTFSNVLVKLSEMGCHAGDDDE